MPKQLRQQRNDVGPHHNLMMLGLEQLCDALGVGQLVVVGLGAAAFKSDRVSLHRTIAVGRHESHYRTRVDASGKESADRHIAHHLHAHRFLNPCAHLLDPCAFGTLLIDIARHPPVASLLHPAPLRGEQRCRGKLYHSPEHRLRPGHVAERQIRLQGRRVQLGLHIGYGENGFGFAREDQPFPIVPHIYGLDAEAVAPHQKPAAPGIP